MGQTYANWILVDDGINNDSAIRVTEPSSLAAGLSASPIQEADIDRIEFYLNGSLAKILTVQDLVSTPIGLQYSFNLQGLDTNANDVIEARVIANRWCTNPGFCRINRA